MSEPKRYTRRRAQICREGWYYVFVVTFIGGGAILRQVNPLFALAALMIAPLVFNWRVSMGMLGRLTIKRKLPERISAGEHLVVDVEFTNDRHRLETLGINGSDRLTLIEPRIDKFRAVAEFMVPRVQVKNQASATYRCILNRRGKYRFGPMRVATRFPIGLVEASMKYRKADELVVAPRVGTLTPEWTNLVFRKQIGVHQSVSQRGANEGDFYAIRQWRSGDSKRWIHWRTTARLGSLAVKQFERQSERDLTVVLHLWQSEKPTEQELDYVEVAASFAATAVVQSFQHTSGHVAIGIAGEECVSLSSMTTKSFKGEVLDQLAVAQAGPNVDLERVLVETVEASPPNAKLVLVSTRPPDWDQLLGERTRQAGIDPEELKARIISVDVTEAETLERLFRLG